MSNALPALIAEVSDWEEKLQDAALDVAHDAGNELRELRLLSLLRLFVNVPQELSHDTAQELVDLCKSLTSHRLENVDNWGESEWSQERRVRLDALVERCRRLLLVSEP